ncbi:MAG TPA: hypothetical protein P5572_18255 [Phycisphaerae bacterium]|nr:hypothetical protein [Phycisphaerae bacterium]
MRFRLICAVLVLTAGVLGCQRKRFEVVMQVTDEGVRRTVSVWAEETVDSNGHAEERITPLEDASSNGLAAIYGAPERLADGRTRYAGTFKSELPTDLVEGDLHNFARVNIVRSPLGMTVNYVERMPGQTDMLAVTQAAQSTCDLLITAWIAYAERQPDFRESPEQLERLERFLRTDLRRDMLNFGLTMWLEYGVLEGRADGDASSNGVDGESEMVARSAAFLLEHGYLRAEDLAGIADDGGAVTRGVVRRVAEALGYPPAGPFPPMLAALANGKTSIEDVTSSGLAALGKSEDDLSTNAGLIVGDLGGSAPSGTVKFRNVPHEPRTNGRWNAKTQTIAWSTEYVTGAQLPKVLYATFSIPRDAFCVEHLGRSLPDGTVEAFNAWYAPLTAEQRAVVDRFCGALEPGAGLRDAILRFDLSAPSGRGAEPGDPEKLPAGMRAILPDK